MKLGPYHSIDSIKCGWAWVDRIIGGGCITSLLLMNGHAPLLRLVTLVESSVHISHKIRVLSCASEGNLPCDIQDCPYAFVYPSRGEYVYVSRPSVPTCSICPFSNTVLISAFEPLVFTEYQPPSMCLPRIVVSKCPRSINGVCARAVTAHKVRYNGSMYLKYIKWFDVWLMYIDSIAFLERNCLPGVGARPVWANLH